MSEISVPISINSPDVRRIRPTGGRQEAPIADPQVKRILETHSHDATGLQRMETGQRSRERTVFEYGGKVVASIGEKGGTYYAFNSDGNRVRRGAGEAEVTAALREKYGSALLVHNFETGRGPSHKDVVTGNFLSNTDRRMDFFA